MDKILFKSYNVAERSQLSFVKREIHNLVRIDFGENRTGEIDIVVSELCSNLIKHAGSGEILYRLSKENNQPLFEIISIDNGPGMKDVVHSSKDGISSKNTLGQGLGAISRLSSFSQVYSTEGWGTIIYAGFRLAPLEKASPGRFIFRCLNVAKPGETVSGDGIEIRRLEDKVMVLAGDGLGHGPHAKEAVDKAIEVFNSSVSTDPAELIKELHAGVKKTRGLVATIAELDFSKKKWEVCGIGNIHTRLQQGLEYRNYICNNGIISLNIPGRIENAVWNMEKFQMLIFCSDGIKTRWDIARYSSILKYDPMILAAALYKDHARQNDDMTILIIKIL